jgi:heme A synthase
MGAIIEVTHRFFAVVTTPLIVTAAVVAWRKYRTIGWLIRPLMLSIVLVGAVSVFGALVILTGLPPALAAVDVGSALLALASVLTAWRVAAARRQDTVLPSRFSFRSPFAVLVLAALASGFLVLISGVLVAEVGSIARCLGWPLYGPVPGAAETAGILAPTRRALGGIAAVLVAAAAVHAWRLHPGHAAMRRAAAALGLALLAEAAAGALMVASGFSMPLGVLSVAAAVGIWGLLIILAVLAAISTRTHP